MRKTITFDSFIRTATTIVGIVLLIKVIDYLSAVLLPFFVAWFVAYLIFPLVSFFQYKLRLHYRALAIAVTMIVLLAVGALLVWLVVPPIIEDCDEFIKVAQSYIDKTTHRSGIETFVARFFNDINITNIFSNKDLVETVRSLLPKVWNVVQHAAGVIISLISWGISVLYLFFILYDYERIAHGWRKLVPARYHARANALFKDLEQGMNTYFRGQFLIAVCVGVLYCVGFTIIDFPLAIPLGILVGILSFIPYLHALGLIPAILFSAIKAAETGQNFWLVVISVLAVFVVVQAIQDLVLTPKIMGKAIGLPPFLIFLSLSVWGYLLGIIGMIVALPLTTLLFSYYKRYISKAE
jgi:predicted PurR-regulated permease PerM